MKHSRELLLIAAATICLIGVGCAKKKVAAAPPPPPPPSSEARSAPSSTPSTPMRSESAPSRASAEPTRYPDAATRAKINDLLAKIEDAYFDYNKHNLRPDAVKALEADSTELRDILKDYPDYKLTIEGHCDERGSEEYNIALGDARAQSARDYLAQVGIPSNQLNLVSYGKDRPVCQDHDEDCWQKNRRIHIVAQAGSAQ